MKGIALTVRGFEDICINEIKELINVKAEKKDNLVLFEAKDYYDFCKLCYVSQSISKTGILLLEKKFKSLESIKEAILKVDFSEFTKESITFAVKSIIKENEEIESSFFCPEIGEAIIDNLTSKKIEHKVDLDNPKLIFYAILIKNDFYLMLDFAGLDLSKRDYKLFQSQFALKGNLCYCLLRLAEIKSEETILDVFSGSGVIPIEGALFLSKKPVQFYNKDRFSFFDYSFLDKVKLQEMYDSIDKKIIKDMKQNLYSIDANFHNISSAKKNAKAAGVEKSITFSRISIDWLDTKFGKSSVQKIISYLPSPSKLKPESELQKLYKEFFYQMSYIVSENGLMVILIDKSDLFKASMEKDRFILVSEKEIYQGEKSLNVLILKKKN